MQQSLEAIKIEGVISIIGFVGGTAGEKEPGFLNALQHLCIIRGLMVGSREQFQQMNRAIDVNKIKPVLDQKEWGFEQTKDAYEYMVSCCFPP